MINDKSGVVMVIGVLDKKGSTNIPMTLSIIKQGFHIIPINYRTIISKYGYAFFTQVVMSIVTSQKPDLVLVCKGNGIQPQLIADINQYTRTWIYNMDPGVTIDMCPEVVENARISTFSSCTALDMAEAWIEGGANCFYMVQGLDEKVFKPVKPVKKFKADISLIGSKTLMRDELKEYLETAGFIVKFYGPGYTNKEVLDKEFSQVCSSSKYMLSVDSVTGQHKHYFSNRLLRYLGCGVCTFHYDPTNTLQQYFQDGVHLKYFTTGPDLVQKINELEKPMLKENLNDPYKIAMNGLALVQNHFTWDNLINQLLTTALPEKIGENEKL